MSEEELKDNLKEFIEFASKDYHFFNDNDFNYHKDIAKSIQGLLDLYNKEKETSHYIQSQLDIANAKLLEEKEKNKEYEEFLSKIEDEDLDIANIRAEAFLDRDKYWEDKIKDKMKEFNKPLLDIAEEQKFPFKYTLDGLSAIQDGVKKVLEDLLKEEKNK